MADEKKVVVTLMKTTYKKIAGEALDQDMSVPNFIAAKLKELYPDEEVKQAKKRIGKKVAEQTEEDEG